jgi:DNA-binding CsgD family transcriptional regulator
MPSTRSTERPAGPGTSPAQQWAKRMAPVLEEGFSLIPIETWERIRTHLRLSPREFEIALCAAVGRSRKQTAKLLRISPATVASYTERTYRKLGIASKGALAAALFRAYRETEPREGG